MKNPKAPNVVIVAALTLVTVILWIIFGVLRVVTTPQPVNVPPEVLEPLDPTLNTEILSDLKSKTFLSEEEIGSFVLTPITPPPEVEEVIEETPLPEESPSPTPISSPEGEI